MSFPPLGLPYKHGTYEGIPLTPVIKPERIQEIRDSHTSRPDDVFIATFPRSGTTWLQQILCLMNDNPQGDQENISLDSPWIELEDKKHIDSMSSPRIFKTHLKWKWLPKSSTDGVKYIYCYRNPKDVCVSYYHYMQGFKPLYQFHGSFDEFCNNIFLAQNASENGSYFDHIAEWMEQKYNRNILFLTYEDMSENLEGEVRRIAKFLNIELSDEKLDFIKGKSSFKFMKNSIKFNYNWLDTSIKDPNSDFIRKGTVGDWKNYLSVEQSEKIEELTNQSLVPLGAKVRYNLE